MARRPPQRTESPDDGPARRRIVAAARQQFFTHGIRAVRMDDLAAELGMSKKTLYAHFPSKEALVEAVFLDKFLGLEAGLARIAEECASDFLTGLHRLLARFQRETEEIRPPFVRDVQREAPELFKLAEGRRREVIQRYFGALLEEGLREGFIREDIPIPLMVEILLGAVQAIMNPPKMSEHGLTVASGFSAIISVFLEGVMTRKGRARR